MTGEAVQPRPEKPCNKKVLLMDEYANAADEFSRTLNTLRLTMGVLSKEKYDLMRNLIEQARERTEAARLAVERHIDEHGC